MSANAIRIAEVFRARAVLLGQLAERGFDISDYASAGAEEVAAMYEHDQLSMTLRRPSDGVRARVVFHIYKALRPPNVAAYIESTFTSEDSTDGGFEEPTTELRAMDELVIVSKLDPNDSLVAALDRAWADDKMYVTIRSLASLQYNVMEHVLVPPTSIVPAAMQSVLMKRYQADKPKMPTVSRHDPTSIALGLRPGQFCSIIRPSRTSIVGKYYRLCVQ
jgi:DNA-directed RNA polymerase subunit H (RpoH/RPB5)